MAAMAMGAMTRMEVRSNLAMEPPKSVMKGWKPRRAASLTEAKLMRGTACPAASTAVAPMRLAATATM